MNDINDNTCFEAARKCVYLYEFENIYNNEYNYAIKNNLLKNYIWLKNKKKGNIFKFKWDYNVCYNEAKKFNRRSDFAKYSNTAYKYAIKYKWIDDYTWFLPSASKEVWTKNKCYEEAKKYQTLHDFYTHSKQAYAKANKKQWLNDYTWLENKSILKNTAKIDCVYMYIFNEYKAVYIGRTLMRRIKERDYEHIFDQTDQVYKFCKKYNLQCPKMTIIETNLTLKEGLLREDYYVQYYKKIRYNVLNKAKTGLMSGSLGGMFSLKWNKQKCYKEAKKYDCRSKFEKYSPGAYSYAKKHNYLNEYTWMPIPKRYTYEDVYNIAKQYKSRSQFQKENNKVYRKAYNSGWLNDYTWFINKLVYWSYEKCFNEAKKYNYLNDFRCNCEGAYIYACKHKFLNSFKWLKHKVKQSKYDFNTCQNIASKCKNRAEFKRTCDTGYRKSYKEGWINIFFPKKNASIQ